MTEQRTDTLRELARRLASLAAIPVSNRAELNNWYPAAKRLQDWMSAHAPELSGAVPHGGWHYLSDADIRLKSPSYHQEQTLQLMEIVYALERGEVPKTDGSREQSQGTPPYTPEYYDAGGVGEAFGPVELLSGGVAGVVRSGLASLGSTAVRSGLSDDIAQTFAGRIRELTLQSDATAFRVFGGKSALQGRGEGVFLTTRSFVGSGARQSLSLPPGNAATRFVPVRIPSGTTIFMGRAAPQEFIPGQVLRGGGTQIFVPDRAGLLFGPAGFLP